MRHRRRRRPTTTCARSRTPPRRHAAGGGRLGAGDRHPGAARPGADASRPRACRRAGGARAVVSGSCSAATNAQVAAFIAAGGAALADRPAAAGRRAATWPTTRWPGPQPLAGRRQPVLVYATAEPDGRARGAGSSWAPSTPARWSSRRWRASRAAWSSAGVRPADRGRRRDLGRLRAGAGHRASCASAPQIDPGVPWCHAATPRGRRPAPGAEVRQLRRRPTSSAAPSTLL